MNESRNPPPFPSLRSSAPGARAASIPPPTIDLSGAVHAVALLRAELGKAVVGQQEAVDQVLTAFLAGGHVLLEGVPGVGKTLTVLALAKAIGGSFGRVQFTPDLMPSDITGHALYDVSAGQFRVRRGPVFVNFLLADEINRAPAKTQAALLELMQEQQITIEGEALPLPAPFMTLATQNPVEHEGTYPLPEAQLDRFLLKVRLSYPSLSEENAIVRGVTHERVGEGLDVEAVTQVLDLAQVTGLRAAVSRTLVDDRVLDYGVRLVRATREHSGLALGAGPRGAIALIRAARAAAVMAGRAFVTPDDVRQLAPAVLRHRVTIAPELAVEGLDTDQAVNAALEAVEAPRA
jgi:MoxR-like ATPase